MGLIGNAEKVSCAGVVKQAARLIAAADRKLYSDPATAQWTGIAAVVCPDTPALARQVDLLLVFGGDGTMLRAARELAGSHTPILGINIGGLGFLTAVSSDGLAPALKQVWQGEFSFESRGLLQATGCCHGVMLEQGALNDIVISRGIASRLIEWRCG